MLKVGISSCGFSCLDEENFRKLSTSRISAIEISCSDYKDFDFLKVKTLADKYGIEIWSLHLPFTPVDVLDPSALTEEKSRFTYDTYIDIIKNGAEIGIDKFVVHSSVGVIPDEERQQRLKASAAFLSKLADQAEKYGAVIAVEDLPRTCLGNCSDDILYFLSANEKLRVCFDTNHLLKEKNIDFIRKIADKIITVHVSDYDFINERHWLPGEGDNDWQEIYNALLSVGYSGVWMYELGLSPSKTIDRRVLSFEDFYNNAIEIFGGKVPTAIGKRLENLGMWGPK